MQDLSVIKIYCYVALRKRMTVTAEETLVTALVRVEI